MGEHGKRAAPKAAAPRSDAPSKASAPHGRNRATKVEKDRSRRWGPLTAETAIVLGVAAAIVVGAFTMEKLQPTSERSNVSVGEDTIEVHNLGKGGIKPGELQARVIPRTTVKPLSPTALPTTTAKPGKTPKPVVTAAPTGKVPGTGPNLPGQPGSGGGGATCTPIPLIKTCPDPVTEETPEPAPEPTTEPEPTPSTAPTGQAGTQGAAGTASKTEAEKAAAAKKKKPTPTPSAASESTSR